MFCETLAISGHGTRSVCSHGGVDESDRSRRGGVGGGCGDGKPGAAVAGGAGPRLGNLLLCVPRPLRGTAATGIDSISRNIARPKFGVGGRGVYVCVCVGLYI